MYHSVSFDYSDVYFLSLGQQIITSLIFTDSVNWTTIPLRWPMPAMYMLPATIFNNIILSKLRDTSKLNLLCGNHINVYNTLMAILDANSIPVYTVRTNEVSFNDCYEHFVFYLEVPSLQVRPSVQMWGMIMFKTTIQQVHSIHTD